MAMRTSNLCVAALAVFLPASALYACGSSSGNGGFGDDGGSSSGGDGSGSSSGGGGDSSCLTCGDAHSDGYVPPVFEDGGFSAGDCDGGGCTFPPPGAPACANAPPINLVYPADGTMVPPDMNVISVMWTPFGTAYKTFEVDFNNNATYMHVVTKCATQTIDTEQPPQPSGGCELQLDPTMWKFVADHNRGGDPVKITVRGTTDGMCATSSTNSVALAFGQEDILGAIYYWKSTITASGTGGQVWVKSWGDNVPEKDVTSQLGSTCNGCHALSRDGQRMVINGDDSDSDDEYSDMNSSLVDMSANPPSAIGGGYNMGPGYGSFYPDHSKFLLSNGLMANGTPPAGTNATNDVFLYDGNTDTYLSTWTPSPPIATMPDWGPDGKSVTFVVPTSLATWTDTYMSIMLNDDTHVFGGSVYQSTYSGGTFGAPTPLVTSAGENNYYPSYSPDGTLLIFDRAAHDGTVSSLTGCTGSGMQVTCPNDSFSNPNARVWLLKLGQMGAQPVDLANANGSPPATPLAWSNSWPKWSPFLQKYQGHQLLWIAFSSTRDYGLRVRNHVNGAGQFQCYPPDSYEQAGQAHGTQFDSRCQQPQIWMAAIDVTVANAPQVKHPQAVMDPSWHAFWVPFQDITTHNHTPQWTQRAGPPPPDAGTCAMQGMSCTQGSTCCSGLVCQATGTCGMIAQ
jgi:hypothetical protein